jgi:hypothetical protein
LLVPFSWPYELPKFQWTSALFDLFHQAFYIFWTIIVALDFIFQVGPKIFNRSYLWVFVDFLALGRIQILVFLIGPTYPLRSVQTPNQARTRFFFVIVVFLDKFMKYL